MSDTFVQNAPNSFSEQTEPISCTVLFPISMTYDKIMIRTIRMRGNREEVMMIMTNGEKGQMMRMKRMERNEGSQLNGIGNGD